MLAESHPIIRRVLRFLALPYCYMKLVNWDECTSSRLQVLKDLLYIFFHLKYYPDNYTPCRLWEKDREEWKFYYGSSYDPYQRSKLRKEVQQFKYLFLFDNKELSEILCRGIGTLLPKYYGLISPENNFRELIRDSINSTDNKQIIIKPVMGQGGKGIVLAYEEAGEIYVNIGKNTTKIEDFELKESSILQEVVIQHEALSRVASSSVNTIRIVTLYTKTEDTIILSTSMRFGVGDSFVDNWSSGGVAVGVDKNSGQLLDIGYDKIGRQYTEHPVSGIKFREFHIPKWDEIIKMSKDIQKAFPFYKLLGLDIALRSDAKPILIEVNPNPDIVFQEQTAGPLLEDEITFREFKKYNLFVNKYQENLY